MSMKITYICDICGADTQPFSRPKTTPAAALNLPSGWKIIKQRLWCRLCLEQTLPTPKEIKAPNPVDFSKPTLFLAGSIEQGKAAPWQDKLVKTLKQWIE